jgi:phosphoribosylformylglycinamidine synthase subunit PurL
MYFSYVWAAIAKHNIYGEKMFKQPMGNLSDAIEMGLNEEEFNRINEILGRQPNYTELSIFSVMWSEHCSYKNSILELKKLPRGGKRCLVEAGEENAGLIDINDGHAIAFKIESHNHPSAVEPYQGAATGVGGIMRDIFTMGARPLASLNSLRFGPIEESAKNRHLFENVVKGIGDYGNCIGVPTIAGEVYFEDSYSDNCLVNAMTIGLVDADKTASATAGKGANPVFIFGATTGRDGIHGATFASEELTEESEEKKSSVQVGDPFMEKLLLEATLEMIEEDILVGIQDMGAAGITCSTTEMSGKTGSGMNIDLEKVPQRETGMHPYEIMLSESQERMLAVVKKGQEKRIKEICDKWDIICEEIGIVTDNGKVTIYWHGEQVAEVPAYDLVLGGGAPVYKREFKKPSYIDQKHQYDVKKHINDKQIKDNFITVMTSSNIISRNWIYSQFDTQVRTNTIILPGGDASVFRIKGTNKAIASKVDCNGRYVYLNPNRGTQIAVAEAARNVVCTGAEPLAITNNLNFGNPYSPEMFYLFREAVDGMRKACEVFDTPVTGGNVSFYNESNRMAVYPTPSIGMLGLLENYKLARTSWFKKSGDMIYLVGAKTKSELGASEWLKSVHGLVEGDCPDIDLDFEKSLHTFVRKAIANGFVASAHDCSDGGLVVALAEACIQGSESSIGAKISVEMNALSQTELLFSETQSRVVISVPTDQDELFRALISKEKFPVEHIGTVGGDSLRINDFFDIKVEEFRDLYMNQMSKIMSKDK